MKVLLKTVVIIFTYLLLCSGSYRKTTAPIDDQPLYIILKLDDLWYKDKLIHEGWDTTISYLNEKGITSSIGIVGESLEEDNPDYFKWISDRVAEGHEIWNHGYCHCRDKNSGISEFKGKPAHEQSHTLLKTQNLAKEKLGITLKTFGAPYNWSDQETVQALNDIPDIEVWLYKETDTPTDKYVLNRIEEVNLEYPVHNPDSEMFKKGFNTYKEEPVLVIQGHPRSWAEDKNRMEEFKKIISFLETENVRFITPHDYYVMVTNN